MNINDYKKSDWVNVSKGNWSFLSCTDFINHYSRELLVKGKNPFDHPLQLCAGNRSELWFLQSEIDSFGMRLVQTFNTIEKIQELGQNAKAEADHVLNFIRNCSVETIDTTGYRDLWEHIKRYYQHHLAIKYISDYLVPADLETYRPILQEARVYAEPVFDESEKLTRKIISRVSYESHLAPELVSYFTREELASFFDLAVTPQISHLENRARKSILWADKNTYGYAIGEEADILESFLYTSSSSEEIKGVATFAGVVRGIVRIIHDPSQASEFNEGNILVTGMTRPDYLPLIKKAGAIVTDAGGILSHAAISARELKKPCITGTKIATQVLKDGDLVEVDAENGIVRIIKKAE